MTKVLIVDDHAALRQGLRMLLEESAEFRVVEEAADGESALEAVRALALDLVLLDLSMPGAGGLEALRQIRELCPDLPVLVLSMYSEPQYVDCAFRLGASGYLAKEGPTEELLDALRAVIAGRRYVSRCITGRTEGPDRLEREALRLLRRGCSDEELAEALMVSPATASWHRARLLEKYGPGLDARTETEERAGE